MNTTLLIMAAGLGSRYGGNKQIDRIGPNGEILMEYSIFDALEAGFDKIVFVIRKSMDEVFRSMIGDRKHSSSPLNFDRASVLLKKSLDKRRLMCYIIQAKENIEG